MVERGVVTGDVRGLEVCRVVDEPTVGQFSELNDVPADLISPPAEGVILEVGVGANDREAFQLIHGHLPTVAALADAATADARHEVRAAACTSLGKLGGRPAADALLRAAEDADSRVRRAALEALGSIPAAWSAKALERHALEDPSGYASAAAAL